MSASNKILQAAAGNAAGESVYVEDVFSTYLYTGTGSAQTITNGIDLSGEGGLIWTKARSSGSLYHTLRDTERGTLKYLKSNSTEAEGTNNAGTNIYQVNSDGYELGLGAQVNGSGNDYVSWTFRKQAGFFDVVTYTGNGTAGRTVSHNLGSVPGCIIVKSTSTTGNWMVYHRGTASDAETDVIRLNLTNAAVDTALTWNDTAPTSTEFTLGTSSDTNNSGTTYVAYLFAHDDQSFGDDSDESIIKCGSFSAPSQTTFDINLGFEPQFFLVKKTSGTGDWFLIDVMRGFNSDANAGPQNRVLRANTSGAEGAEEYYRPTSTGIQGWHLGSGDYIYIAIRRPMKTPEAGTEVFKPNDVDNGASKPDSLSDFPVDMYFRRYVNTTNDTYLLTRLTSPNALKTNGSDAEAAFSTASAGFDYNDGVMNIFSSDNSDFHTWMFKRATGFFDVVAYTGDGTTNQTENHNLGVVPEFIITKRRNSAYNWHCYSSVTGADKYIVLNTVGFATTSTSIWNNTSPTSTQFTLGNFQSNRSGDTYIAYLFATLDGVSKVGSYTGTGSSQNIDCGFSAGARFILIKNTSDNADWLLYDSERGIVSGNDPYLAINDTAAEVTNTDYVDPLNAGFTVNGSNLLVNASGDTYLFLAIA